MTEVQTHRIFSAYSELVLSMPLQEKCTLQQDNKRVLLNKHQCYLLWPDTK